MSLNISLVGKSVVIVGTSGGLGEEIASTMAQAGAFVSCLDVNYERTQMAVHRMVRDGHHATARECDVQNERSIRTAIQQVSEEYGRVDILVYAAAHVDPSGAVTETSLDVWKKVLAVNVTGAFSTSRVVLPFMIGGGGGVVLFIGSQLGHLAAPRRGIYCTVNGAIVQLARSIALDYAGNNIRSLTLSPGPIETPRLVARYGDINTAQRVMEPQIPMRRLGLPHEIAGMAVVLVSDVASFMTGCEVIADGGYSIS